LDIGGEIGALVVSMPPSMVDVELEICPAGRRRDEPDEGAGWWPGDWRSAHGHLSGPPAWPHVGVLARGTADGVAWAAVFPGLRSGWYELWRRPDGPTALLVHVAGAEVTTATWP
jgi:hypothetical protein